MKTKHWLVHKTYGTLPDRPQCWTACLFIWRIPTDIRYTMDDWQLTIFKFHISRMQLAYFLFSLSSYSSTVFQVFLVVILASSTVYNVYHLQCLLREKEWVRCFVGPSDVMTGWLQAVFSLSLSLSYIHMAYRRRKSRGSLHVHDVSCMHFIVTHTHIDLRSLMCHALSDALISPCVIYRSIVQTDYGKK